MCEFLPVTRQAYYKWIKDNKIRNSRINVKNDNKITTIIKHFYNEFQIVAGVKNIKLYA